MSETAPNMTGAFHAEKYSSLVQRKPVELSEDVRKAPQNIYKFRKKQFAILPRKTGEKEIPIIQWAEKCFQLYVVEEVIVVWKMASKTKELENDQDI